MEPFLQKHRGIIMKIMAFVLFLGCISGGCSLLNRQLGLKDDNEIEQAIEALIESQTGVPVDLTPENSIHYGPHHYVI